MSVEQRSSKRAMLTASVCAVVAGAMASHALAADTFKISLGVRETNTTSPIGGNGGTTASAGGGTSIEWVNLDGQSLVADGSWQTFTWNFGSDPITTFAGTQPTGGALNHIDVARGALETLRVLNNTGVANPVTLWIDNIVNTTAGVSTTIENFDALPTGTGQSVFRQPNFSGSTNGLILAGDTIRVVNDVSDSAPNSYRATWQWKDSNPTNWLRLTTNGAPTLPNPAIAIDPTSSLTIRLRATVTTPTTGWQVDADGNYSDVNNWAGGVPNSASLATAAAVARFGNVIPATAPRTVTLDISPQLNSMVFDSAQPFTIQDSSVGGAPTGLQFGAPNSQFDATISVLNGNHVINSGIFFGTTTPRLALNVVKATDSLAINGTVFTTDAPGAVKVTAVSKAGAGKATINTLNVASITVTGGTLALKSGGTVSQVYTLSTGGTPVAPAGKLDINNNGVIVDYGTSAVATGATATTTSLLDQRNRIVAAYHAGAWDGNGIMSSSIDSQKAIGYAEASAIGITPSGGLFMGTAVDDSAVVMRVTYKGDANIDGTVTFTDLVALAQNYNSAYDPTGPAGPKLWSQGDFNYDGIVNFNDLVPLAQNYNKTLSAAEASQLGAQFASDFALAQQLVPEPTTLGLLAGGLTMVLRRRRA